MSQQTKRLYEFGPFRLDAQERLLLRDREIVPLTPKAFDMLLALVENSGRLLGKQELMQRLWPDSFVEEGSLAQNVSLLRRALGENLEGEKFIETVPRRGYRFIASVRGGRDDADFIEREHSRASIAVTEEQEPEISERYAESAQAGTQKAIEPSGGANRVLKPKQRFLTASLALMVVVATLLYFLILRKPEQPTGEPSSQSRCSRLSR